MKPYGYVRKDGEGIFLYGEHQFQNPQDHDLVPVYTKREWVGLTDEEYQEILKQHDGAGLLAFYNLVEAKLKEKNT